MNFDLVAGSYRYLEFLVFGRYLERCRVSLLPQITPGVGKALFIGEGDGRFLERFLQRFPETEVDVVEASPRMLELAKRRAERLLNKGRVRFVCQDIFTRDWPRCGYDLVVTHFFLDVLTEAQLQTLINGAKKAAPNALWLLSEFQIVDGPEWARQLSRLCIRVMYIFFRTTTGLQVASIPNYRYAFTNAGMKHCAKATSLGGFLSSELWIMHGSGLSTLP